MDSTTGRTRPVLLVTLLFLVWAPLARAGRSVTAVVIPWDFLYLAVNNPSALPQTVSIAVETRANLTIQGSPGTLGITCPTNKKCVNDSSHQNLPPGGSLYLRFEIADPGCAFNVCEGPTSGTTVTLSVAEDRGAVLAHASAAWTPQNVNISIPINGGRPF